MHCVDSIILLILTVFAFSVSFLYGNYIAIDFKLKLKKSFINFLFIQNYNDVNVLQYFSFQINGNIFASVWYGSISKLMQGRIE